MKSLINFALMLSKDTRGGIKDGGHRTAKTEKHGLLAIEKEQKEYENYQMKFESQSNDSCCLLL